MNHSVNLKLLAIAMSSLSMSVTAGTDTYFVPLTESAPVGVANDANELSAPWVAPVGVEQTNLTSLDEAENTDGQSIVRVSDIGTGGRPKNASMFDMVSYDNSGRYIFIPHETFTGAGVSRYDTIHDTVKVLFKGDLGGLSGDWSNDFGAFDPSTFTPAKTLLLAEEWSGEGRVIEVRNPLSNGKIKKRELESIANVSHEGLRFSKDGKTLYYVDEWNSGSIYKTVFKSAGDYSKNAQTFVLKVDNYNGNPADYWNESSNENAPRTGSAKWIPLSDKKGNPLTAISAFKNGPTNDPRTNSDTRGGRPAADQVGATPYGRPEDIEVGTLANGKEVVYFAATSEKTVYAIVMEDDINATVQVFASEASTPKNLGFDATTGVLNSPDNLAQDAWGNIYIIEDAPNNSDIGGDVWFARDVDGDGVAESMDHFLSIGVDGSEATGMIFNPKKPYEFVMAVQHPESTDLSNVTDGFGDALWKFDISAIAPSSK